MLLDDPRANKELAEVIMRAVLAERPAGTGSGDLIAACLHVIMMAIAFNDNPAREGLCEMVSAATQEMSRWASANRAEETMQ
jgi:hypothetical protein